MIYGYTRISTKQQSIERQIRNIKDLYPNAVIIEEVYTGTKIYGRKESKIFLQSFNLSEIKFNPNFIISSLLMLSSSK